MQELRIHNYKDCSSYWNCFSTRFSVWDLDEGFGTGNVLVGGSLMDPLRVFNNQNYSKYWDSLYYGLGTNVTFWNVRRDILKLILNPEESLRKRLLFERRRLLQRPYTFGIQLRMGGNVSDTPESYVGVPFSRLRDVVKQVDEVVLSRGWNPLDVQIYISSDSSLAISEVARLTKGIYKVIESKLYKHGHSGSHFHNNYEQVMKKVTSDFYYMSLCDYMIVTWPSSMGRMMCALVDEENCDAVLHWKITNKNIPIPSFSVFCYTHLVTFLIPFFPRKG